MLFSATFPLTVLDFKNKFINDAQQVNLMEELTLKGVTQYYVYLEEKHKVHCLNLLFSKVIINLIYANTSCTCNKR